MKKIFIILILTASVLTACNDDDSTPATNYKMPMMTGDIVTLKNHLLTISSDITQTQDGNTITIVCKPDRSTSNMFSELEYVYSFKGLELDEFTFSYKLNSDVNQSDVSKLTAFLKKTVIE